MDEFINKTDISDILIERPISFSLEGNRYAVYHPTLGKIQLISRLVEKLGFDGKLKGDAVYLFALSSAEGHRDECLRILAYSTLPGAECLDEQKVTERLVAFSAMEKEGIATLLLSILTMDKSREIMRQYGVDKEMEQMSRISRAKGENRNSVTLAGKTIWGTLIDCACERYGWSYQYVLWGISFANLQMLLADQIKTVYMTDEERKRARVSTDGIVVRADDAKALDRYIKSNSWR